MTTRRGFLGAMLAACAAPAVVKASSLMKIVAPPTDIILPSTQLLKADGSGSVQSSQRSIVELGNEQWNTSSMFFYKEGLNSGWTIGDSNILLPPRDELVSKLSRV